MVNVRIVFHILHKYFSIFFYEHFHGKKKIFHFPYERLRKKKKIENFFVINEKDIPFYRYSISPENVISFQPPK